MADAARRERSLAGVRALRSVTVEIASGGGGTDALTLDLHYVAYEYGTEAEAKRVWEEANRLLKGVSVWRMHYPQQRPHTAFFCIGMGEEPENVEAMDRVLNQGTALPKELEPELVESLAARRVGQAVEALKRADPELKQVSRTPQGRVIHRDGTMTDYEPPGGNGAD